MKQRNASPIKIFLCRIVCHFNCPCIIISFDIIVTKGLYPLMYCKINHEQKPSAASSKSISEAPYSVRATPWSSLGRVNSLSISPQGAALSRIFSNEPNFSTSDLSNPKWSKISIRILAQKCPLVASNLYPSNVTWNFHESLRVKVKPPPLSFLRGRWSVEDR